MSRLIDADALEKDGWMMHRTVQVDKDTMSYQTKKPTDFHTVGLERKTGKWIILKHSHNAMCSKCYQIFVDAYDLENWDNYCRHCGAIMEDMITEEKWDGI